MKRRPTWSFSGLLVWSVLPPPSPVSLMVSPFFPGPGRDRKITQNAFPKTPAAIVHWKLIKGTPDWALNRQTYRCKTGKPHTGEGVVSQQSKEATNCIKEWPDIHAISSWRYNHTTEQLISFLNNRFGECRQFLEVDCVEQYDPIVSDTAEFIARSSLLLSWWPKITVRPGLVDSFTPFGKWDSAFNAKII